MQHKTASTGDRKTSQTSLKTGQQDSSVGKGTKPDDFSSILGIHPHHERRKPTAPNNSLTSTCELWGLYTDICSHPHPKHSLKSF